MQHQELLFAISCQLGERGDARCRQGTFGGGAQFGKGFAVGEVHMGLKDLLKYFVTNIPATIDLFYHTKPMQLINFVVLAALGRVRKCFT